MKFTVAAVTLGVALAHYGDPYKKDCEKDERIITITGLAGEICSPECGAKDVCPTDVPAGVTGTPTCALSSSSGGPKYCAVVCSASLDEASLRAGDAQCGENASCKAISSSALCTYDDAPPAPSALHWKPINSPSLSDVTEAIGVGFAPDGKVGFMGAGINGVGSVVLKTVDSGVTWAQTYMDSVDLFLAAATKSEEAAIVTGVISNAYTTDGTLFNASKNDYLTPSQDAGFLPDGKFAIINSGTAKNNGPATSVDGKKWDVHTMTGINATIFQARYGSYPTKDTWYVTGGTFPTSNSKVSSDSVQVTRRRRITKTAKGIKNELTMEEDMKALKDPVPCSEDPLNCFSAGIFKTTDGGATWATVYSNLVGNFYPNGIHCASVDTCVAVVEGASCQILITVNGGKDWTETNSDTDSGCSLSYVHMMSEKEIWVSGAHLSNVAFEGRFWHSTDGAKTWQLEAIKGLDIFDLDILGPTKGYALGLHASNGISLYEYVASPPNATLTVTAK